MFGEKRELMTLQCCVCKKWTALQVDRGDLRRHLEDGVFVQHAFVHRDGTPYLCAAERELFISGCCNDCWHLLCPSEEMAYN